MLGVRSLGTGNYEGWHRAGTVISLRLTPIPAPAVELPLAGTPTSMLPVTVSGSESTCDLDWSSQTEPQAFLPTGSVSLLGHRKPLRTDGVRLRVGKSGQLWSQAELRNEEKDRVPVTSFEPLDQHCLKLELPLDKSVA